MTTTKRRRLSQPTPLWVVLLALTVGASGPTSVVIFDRRDDAARERERAADEVAAAATSLAACRLRNTAARVATHGEVLRIEAMVQTLGRAGVTVTIIDDYRTGQYETLADPADVDRDCNDDGKITASDYDADITVPITRPIP